jgi:hypothetical protein
MDAYDCHKIDTELSRRLKEKYGNPKNHLFYSCYHGYIDDGITGSRGGKIRGLKTICYHCGFKESDH